MHDVNILVDAFRADADHHATVRPMFEQDVFGDGAWGYSSLVLSGFLRIVTHPVWDPATTNEQAFEFVRSLTAQPNSIEVRSGPRHMEIFERLCLETGARFNDVPDAYHAALAIEAGAEWVTRDRGYAKYPGLRVVYP